MHSAQVVHRWFVERIKPMSLQCLYKKPSKHLPSHQLRPGQIPALSGLAPGDTGANASLAQDRGNEVLVDCGAAVTIFFDGGGQSFPTNKVARAFRCIGLMEGDLYGFKGATMFFCRPTNSSPAKPPKSPSIPARPSWTVARKSLCSSCGRFERRPSHREFRSEIPPVKDLTDS